MKRRPEITRLRAARGHGGNSFECTTRARRNSRTGMTMIEVMVSMTVLTVSVYIMSSTITTSAMHMRLKDEQAIAVEGARNQFEILRSLPFEQLYALYNSNEADDPQGAGTAPGAHFAIAGLQAQAGDPDGFPGEIIMPDQDGLLSEALAEPDLGMPRDLNGDFKIDELDHKEDYLVLPVAVRVAWVGSAGNRQFQMFTMMAKLEKASP